MNKQEIFQIFYTHQYEFSKISFSDIRNFKTIFPSFETLFSISRSLYTLTDIVIDGIEYDVIEINRYITIKNILNG